jgi:hypothetical protein
VLKFLKQVKLSIFPKELKPSPKLEKKQPNQPLKLEKLQHKELN